MLSARLDFSNKQHEELLFFWHVTKLNITKEDFFLAGGRGGVPKSLQMVIAAMN